MDPTSTLQPPKTGRSRFSKALPAPPPGLDDGSSSAPQGLPPFPFPPRKESVTTATSTSRSVKTERFDSPLPALPPKADVSQIQSPKNMIPRRPVGQAAPKSNKMKRVSSISSLLSAYSNGSSDSVHRSSQETVLTKDSDPSHSRERGEVEDAKDLTRILMAYSSNPYGDESPSSKDDELHFPMPPSTPSLNVTTQPGTPRSMRPLEIPQTAAVSTSSPISLSNDSPKQEIWRRRAGSKSDVGIAVPELKLAVSHGSTAATASDVPGDTSTQKQEPPNNITRAEPSGLPLGSESRLRLAPSHDMIAALPQPPQKPLPPQPQTFNSGYDANVSLAESRPIETGLTAPNNSTAGAAEPSSTSVPQNSNESKVSTLPPRLGSLPGRNIRPRQQATPEDDKTKAKDSGKRKELTPAAEPSNDAPKDFFRVSPRPELQQKTSKGLPASPRIDAQPARSPAVDTPKDQPTEHKFLPRTPHSITRKGLPTPAQSPSNVQSPVTQTVRSPAPTPTSLPSPDEPPRGSERPPAAQLAAGVGRSQPNAHLKSDSTSSRAATGLRRPFAEPLAQGDPSNRAAGVRPARSQHDLSFSTMSSNYTHGKQNPTGKRVSPTMGAPPSRDPGSTVQVEPTIVVQPSATPSPAAAAAANDTSSFLQGSDLFDLVTNLNSSDVLGRDSPSLAGSLGKGLRARPVMISHDSRPLSQINEVPRSSTETMNETVPRGVGRGDQEDPVLSKEINEALLRFPRERLEQLHQASSSSSTTATTTASTSASTGPDRVWPSRPPSKENYNCWTNHETMVPTRNTHYALACQSCGVEDKEWRKVCSWCNVRICYECSALLASSGGDLRRVMDKLSTKRRLEKGKDKMDSPSRSDGAVLLS